MFKEYCHCHDSEFNCTGIDCEECKFYYEDEEEYQGITEILLRMLLKG